MKITDSITLSDEALSNMIAIVGRTGTGKTYTAKGIVEKLLQLGRRVILIDPTGAWWGLRLDASGKKPSGLKVIIFGGDHGDVPIDEHAARALGKLLGEQSLQCVIDLSLMLPSEQRRFMANFLEALYLANRTPLHLVIDEADEFAPQKPPPEATMCLSQMDRVARRGRVKGLRPLVITQRPAVLNKDVLAMAGVLVSMQLTLGNDRDAIKRWIEGQADPKVGKEVLDSLPKLKRGEGWVWAPGDALLERCKFPTITTYDSSSTPEHGSQAKTMNLGELDLSSVKAAMAGAIATAKASDPEILREEIASLKDQLRGVQDELDDAKTAAPAAPVVDTAETDRLREQIAWFEERAAAVARATIGLGNALKNAQEYAEEVATRAVAMTSTIEDKYQASTPTPESFPPSALTQATPIGVMRVSRDEAGSGSNRAPAPGRGQEIVDRAERLRPLVDATAAASTPIAGGPIEKLINAILWWESIRLDVPTRDQVAFIAGYTASGGSFKTYLSRASTSGLIRYEGDGLRLQPEGRKIGTKPSRPGTRAELHRRVLEHLETPLRKILGQLIPLSGQAMTRTQLAESCGYEASGGSFKTYLSRLSSLKLVKYPNKTTVAASPLLFPS